MIDIASCDPAGASEDTVYMNAISRPSFNARLIKITFLFSSGDRI
jgi:hypothetical protein